MVKRALLSMSGGADSTTLLGWLLHQGYEVMGAFFSYGSKHNSFEIKACRNIAAYYGIPLTELRMEQVMQDFKSNLLQTGKAIPEGHYSAPSMNQTVVPGRNIIFLSVLAGLAWSKEIQQIAIGIHQGDHAIYPDCRPEFYEAMNTAILLGTDQNVDLLAPFVYFTKGDIVKWGVSNGVPYHLTRTCYKEQELACGKCGACVERLEAFTQSNAKDPLQYERK